VELGWVLELRRAQRAQGRLRPRRMARHAGMVQREGRDDGRLLRRNDGERRGHRGSSPSGNDHPGLFHQSLVGLRVPTGNTLQLLGRVGRHRSTFRHTD
jgi:hypothetical protein